MKTTTLLFFIIGLIALVAIFGLIKVLRSPESKTGEKILKKSGTMIIMLILISLINSDLPRNYSLYDDQNTWEKYHLPQIDSLMRLNIIRPQWSHYNSMNKDSIYHSDKMTHFDLFDIYSIEDDFVNEIQDKILTVKFIKPNIIRDSLRVITLKSRSDYMDKLPVDTLSMTQFDSILIDWGLRNGLYEKLIEN
jgi:hypothetical protein